MSFWAKAMTAAKSAVTAPTMVTTAMEAGASAKRKLVRATR